VNFRSALRTLRSTRPRSLLLVWAGAATASWDVVGVDLAGRTLKLTTLCFLLGAVFWLAEHRSAWRWTTLPTRHRLTVGLTLTLLGWMGIRSVFTSAPISSLSGFAAQLIPAGAPFIAVLWHRTWASTIVRAFVYGMAATSVAAIYEVIAKSNGWYWPTAYEAKVNGTFRAAGFAFEAAYFAAPAVAAIVICLFWWPRGVGRLGILAVIFAAIVAANARIVFVQIVVAFIVLVALGLWMRGAQRVQLLRGLAGVVLIGAIVGLGVLLLSPSMVGTIGDRAASIFDPNEVTSNSPRLEEAERVGDVIIDHPIIGIGPGRLGDEFRARGFVDDATQNNDATYVTNNTWTQSLVDGGVIALALQLAVVVSVIAGTRRAITMREAAVLTAWLSLVLAAGLTVSNFWDTELWLLLACHLGLTSDERTPGAPVEHVDESVPEHLG